MSQDSEETDTMDSSEEEDSDKWTSHGWKISDADKERIRMMRKANEFPSLWDDDSDVGVEDDLNPDDADERKILIAAEIGCMIKVREFLDKNKNLVNAKDKDLYTPLHRACYNNHVDIILVHNGADIHAVTTDGWTPLHSACHWNSAKCAEILLAIGSDINAITTGGLTSLHLAAMNHGRETVKLLLLHPDVDASLKNANNETAFDIARKMNNMSKYFEIVEPCVNKI